MNIEEKKSITVDLFQSHAREHVFELALRHISKLEQR
jgi:hypothetical protein